MSASLLKVPLVLSAALAYHQMLTPPTPPAAQEERVEAEGVEKMFQHVARMFPYVLKAGFWATSFAEVTVILASKYPDNPLSQRAIDLLTGSPRLTIAPPRISPIFLFGTALTVGGALFRIASFCVMGRHFTYELSVKPEHRLVTSFPYSVVRHPSYTGAFVAIAGVNAMLFGARGGFVREVIFARNGWDEVPRRGLATAIMVGLGTFQAAFSFGLLSRVPQEDAMMRKEFGKEWDDWAKRVPYKLVPGIY